MAAPANLQQELRAALRSFKDFPTEGILFEDIMPIFRNPKLFQLLLDGFKAHLETSTHAKPTVVIGLESRGFLFGPTLALQLGLPFVPVRKPGKLPGALYTAEYQKEYGTDTFAMQKDALEEGSVAIIVDDIIATGGSAAAAGDLVKQAGGTVAEYLFILELLFLHGRDKLEAPVFTLLGGQE